MSSSEIAFLALGLVLGGALGAAFLAAVRSRPARRREIRITIAPNSIGARRAVTLADPIAARDRPSPPGSPDDAAWPDRSAATPRIAAAVRAETPIPASPLRTRVPSIATRVPAGAVAMPVGNGCPVTGLGGVSPGPRHSMAHDAAPALPVRSAVAIAVGAAPAPARLAPRPATPVPIPVLDVGWPTPERLVRPRDPAPDPRPTLVRTAVAIPIARADEARADEARATSAHESGSVSPDPAPPVGAVDPCASARTAAEERCAEAVGARGRARVAADAVRDARRALDALSERIDLAREASDPRAIAATKAALHAAFREANKRAATPGEAEAAARHWLSGIDRANRDARSALRIVESGSVELRDQRPALERMAVEADAARITAEGNDQACRAAREDLARCEEAVALALAPAAEEPHPFAEAWPTEADLSPDRRASGVPAEILAGLPAIVRMLRGDRVSRDRVVATLAGGEPAAVATWQLRLSALVDAIAARAIEAGYLDLPDDDPFWALFVERERREIVESLSSLGFRFDGLGGFADGRVPAARDLSLAVGYAGLDPMRIRIWPHDEELGGLYARASVAADEWLTVEADDLALGAVVDALGHRAADLGELWNAWGRVRPLLLATD